MESCGLGPEDCVMVGDNLQTDILGGNRTGLRTVWIRGAGMEQDPEAADAADNTSSNEKAVPDLTVWSIAELLTP
jgi:FMN phosphatase YigB (HAD superfamily)